MKIVERSIQKAGSMSDLINCPRCNCKIRSENLDMNCHSHNDKNLWRSEEGIGKEIFVILRTLILEDKNESH